MDVARVVRSLFQNRGISLHKGQVIPYEDIARIKLSSWTIWFPIGAIALFVIAVLMPYGPAILHHVVAGIFSANAFAIVIAFIRPNGVRIVVLTCKTHATSYAFLKQQVADVLLNEWRLMVQINTGSLPSD